MDERWKLEMISDRREPVSAVASLGKPEATLVLLVGLVVVALLGAAGWALGQAHHTALKTVEIRTAQRAKGLEEAVARFLNQSERTAIHIVGDFFRVRRAPGGIDADALARLRHRIENGDALVPMPLGVIDADGRLVLVTEDRRQPQIERLIRDRPEIFQPPAEPEPPRLVVVGPEAPGAPSSTPLFLCWRVAGVEGGFAVVVAVADVDGLRAVVGTAGAGGAIGLVGTDGAVLFKSPLPGVEGFGDLSRALLTVERLRASASGELRGSLTEGGPELLLAFRRIDSFPLVAVAVTSQEEGLRSWRTLMAGVIVVLLGLVALVATLVVAHLGAMGRARRELERRIEERTLDQRRAAERLLAAERLGHLGHWEHDLLAGCGYWSSEAYHIFGLAIGHDYLDFERVLAVIHPADRDAECTARILASAGVKPYDMAFRILRPDGSIRHVHAQAEVLRDDHGMPIKLIGTFLDITERVAIQCRLRESEEKYRKTFEAAQDALFLVERQGRTIVDANDSACRLYGYGREDLLAMPWSALAELSAVQAGAVRHRRRDGGEIHVELTVAEVEFQGRVVDIVAVRDVTARAEAEAGLARTTALLTDAERIAQFGCWDWNRSERCHHWSSQQWRILGLDPAATAPGFRSFLERVHPADRARVAAFPSSVGGAGEVGTIDFRILRPDGAERHLHTTCRVERDADSGAITRLFAIQMDVTERKHIETALAASHAAMLAVINATQEDAVMLIDAEGVVQIANERAARSFDRPMVEVCGQPICAMMSPETCERWSATVATVIATGQHLRFEQARGGAVYDAHLSPAFDPSGQTVGVAVFERDITARKRADANLRLLTRAMEQSPLSVVVTDAAGRIEYVNPHFITVTGYTAEEVIGKNPSLFKSGYTSAADYQGLWATIGRGEVWQGEFHNRRKNGDLRWQSATIVPVRDEHGANSHYVAIEEDITQRKLAEIELLSAKERAEAASLSKSQFLATISHELRTPLNAILGFSEIITEVVKSMPGEGNIRCFGDYARHIHSNGTHLLGLINDLLDLAKIEAGKFDLHEEFVDIEDVIFVAMEMLRSRAEAGQILLTSVVEPNLPVLRADDRAMRHILINLLSNAVKFTPSGGAVEVRVRIDDRGLLVLEIADTGIGIAEEDIATALEPFGQIDNALSRRHDGTGLGLPLCRSLVEMHNGHLEIASAIGVGTTVTVRLPRYRIVCAGAGAWAEPVV